MRNMTPKTDAELETLQAEWKAGAERARKRAAEGRGMPAWFHRRAARAYRRVGDEENAAVADRMADESARL